MQLTYLGHSSFLLKTKVSTLLFDPFISPNSLVNEVRKNALDPAAMANLDPANIKCDYVLLSHGHEDHVADAEAILKRTGAKVVSNFEIVSWYAAKGITNNHPMNLGGRWTFDFGRVKYVPAIHSSGLPDGAYGGNPGGFVIQADGKTIYYSGDTALSYDMKLIAEEFELDYAIMCIGDNFTMGPKDVLKASDFVNCNNVIGMHYDTFGYIKIDHSETIKMFESKGKKLTLMNIGETKEL